MIEQIAGTRPPGCPWMAYSDPIICEILSAYGSVVGGMGATTALLLPSDPPHVVWQGVNYFRHVSAKVHEHESSLRKKP